MKRNCFAKVPRRTFVTRRSSDLDALVRYHDGVTGKTGIRCFYAFLLMLMAWGGFVQVALKDDLPQRQIWTEAH